MKTSFTLGAEVDIATGGEVTAAANSAADGLFDRLTRTHRRPTYTQRAMARTVPTGSTAQAFDLGAPPDGKLWYLIHAGFSIVKDGAFLPSVAGYLFVGTNLPTDAAVASAITPMMTAFVHKFPATDGWEPNTPFPIFPSSQVFGYCVADGTGGIVNVTFSALYAEVDDKSALRGSV